MAKRAVIRCGTAEMTRARVFARVALLPFVCLILAAVACSQTNNPIIYVTATPFAVPSGEPTLPNPFRPTPTPSGPTATPIQPTPNPTFPPVETTVSYTVQDGDTLASIAQLYGVGIDQVIALNKDLSSTTTIFPGQVVTVPGRPSPSTPNINFIPDSER